MTLAFEKFMRQHEKTGGEKADGYSDDVFLGLAEHEKNVVFSILLKELPWSAEWIFLVDRERAVAALAEKESELRGNGHEHVYLIQQNLVKNTGNLEYQKHMFEDYAVYVNRLKPLVVDSIGRTPVNKELIDFLKEVILVETDVSAVARASRHLLRVLKFPNNSDIETANYKQLDTELRGENTQAKQKALLKLEKYESNIASLT